MPRPGPSGLQQQLPGAHEAPPRRYVQDLHTGVPPLLPGQEADRGQFLLSSASTAVRSYEIRTSADRCAICIYYIPILITPTDFSTPIINAKFNAILGQEYSRQAAGLRPRPHHGGDEV